MIKFKFQLLLLLFLIGISYSAQAQEYPKVILSGDYPDPTIVRDGADYYMTHSPFFYMPGFLIWHSQDLVNWQPISRVVPEYEGSAMAPDLTKYNGRFYLYFPSNRTNYVVWADNIQGPWSKPIDLKVGGIDPGHVVGEDGKRYLYVNDGRMIQLSDDGLSSVGELKKVYNGWEFSKNWETEGMWLESPKFIKKDGYYYLISAQGGTAGPPTSHMVVVARSKSVRGPWENSPYNPIVHTYSANENWWSKGHGTIIDDVNGNWWIVYHAYANGYHTLGRQTLLEPIEWTADGWCRAKIKAQPIAPQKEIKHGLVLSDNFDKSELGLQWTFWKEFAPKTVIIKNNTLQLQAKGKTPADARKLLTTATDKSYVTQVEVQVESGNQAGLMLFYNEKAYTGIISDSKNFTIYKDAETSFSVPNKLGKKFFLKIQNKGNICTFSASKDNQSWTILAENVDVSKMHHNNYKGFYALRPCLVSMGKGKALFKNFVYSNAIPTEDDMSAYLMVFHKDDTHSLHMALSADGYSFTALNDGKPSIGGDTIADQLGIRDPHIYRGPDGAFYMSMTDLHVFGKRDGKRDTEWERDGNIYGWGNNRGLVLMKSWDLINWKRTNIRFNELSAQYAELGCAWAPETTYDDVKGKLMIYFTMRYQKEANKLYYVYVNEDYNRLESMPELLFQYPNEKISAIDADITKVGDKYRMFYVSHDGQAGIKQAVSDRINGEYEYDSRWYDPEERACEAPNVWKRIGEDKWVLMYDCYGQKVHNFGFIETSNFVHFTNLKQFNEGAMKTTNFTSPKHGAIIQITKEEADLLAKYWNLDMQFLSAKEYRKMISSKNK
ncbi:family 43 glycosylhydrolase [Paludibacter sp.]